MLIYVCAPCATEQIQMCVCVCSSIGRTPKLLDILYIARYICCVALRCFWLSLTNPIMMSRLHNSRARKKTRRRTDPRPRPTERAEEEGISRLGQRATLLPRSSHARVCVHFQGHRRGDRLRRFHQARRKRERRRANKSIVCFSVPSSLTLESRVQQVATTTVLPTNQTARRMRAKNRRATTNRLDKSITSNAQD